MMVHTILSPFTYQRLHRLSVWFIMLVILIATLVLIGWQWDIGFLRRPIPGLPAMNPMSAICFLMLGVVFFAVAFPGRPPMIYSVARWLAVVVLLIGMLRLGGFLIPALSAIDRFIYPVHPASDHMGVVHSPMALNTALCFVCCSLSLLLLPGNRWQKVIPIHLPVLLVGAISLLSVLGYIYRVKEFYGFLRYVPMSIHTGACFLLLSLSLLFVTPDKGIMKILTGTNAGSITAQRLIPYAFLVPVLLGWLRLYGSWVGAFTIEFGVSMLVLSIIVCFVAVIWYNARLLDKRDLLQKKVETDLRESERRFRLLADSINEDLASQVREKTETISRSNSELRALASHLQDVREEERSGIAREIHDELGQQLTGLRMDIGWIAKKISPAENMNVHERIKSTLKLLDTTIQTVRRIATELRPSILDDLGLIAAVEWHSQEFERRSGIRTRFHPAIPEMDCSSAMSIGLFRICQEALTNVARHSGAKQVDITLESNAAGIILQIADDGRGLDQQKPAPGAVRSLGMLGMKERALMMGGSVNIRSERGKGLILTVTVPLARTDTRLNTDT
jgi:signal transduction histidine kinase